MGGNTVGYYPARQEQRRFLFKRDHHYEIVKDKDGLRHHVPLSIKGRTWEILDRYGEWAEQNGAPVPNPKLFKLYRDQWSKDPRFPSFYDWLEFLGIEEDAMPPPETFEKLRQDDPDSLKFITARAS